MKKALFFFIITILIYSCASQKKATEAGRTTSIETNATSDGLSFKTAIVIHEKTENKGVSAEYAWIREHYPNSQVGSQSLSYNMHKPYDIIDIITSDGNNLKIYFDISNFYGNF